VPKSGYTSITISDEVAVRCREAVKIANKKAGYKKYRSVSHFVEAQVMQAFDALDEK